MPELPEVESLRRSLVDHIVGQKITTVQVLLPKIVSSKGTTRTENPKKLKQFETELLGKKITNLKRRAKNLLFELEDGSILLGHLKMTGQFIYVPWYEKNMGLIGGGHPIQDSEAELPHKHTYVIINLEKGSLYYNDVRQFGYLLYYSSEESMLDDGHFAKLGVEPLEDEFSLESFVEKMKSKTAVLKSVLLNQEVVVGLGNIYADECCFLSGIRPTRKITSIKKAELEKLFFAIKSIVPKAVSEGGSSIANYLLADGSRGNYARYHFVYNRKNKPCKLCGTTLQSLTLAGRTTVFCPHCQK